MHPNKPTEPGVSAQKPASIEKQPCIAAQPVETHNELYARSASQETDQKAKINKPSAIKPTGFVLAKNKPMVIKPAGGVKKPNKTGLSVAGVAPFICSTHASMS